MGKKKFNTIKSSDLKTAVETAFCEYDKFSFFHNVEVKDVQKRFRAFCFNGKNYVAKQAKNKTATDEIENAARAARLLNGLSVSGFVLNVVEPILVETPHSCYLVSEYKGTTLHEYVYNNDNLPLSQNCLMVIYTSLITKGVVHPGFLPRNVIINQKSLFLLDWENVFFSKKAHETVLKHISVAEFVNNWGCLYSREFLLNSILKYISDNGVGNKTGSFGKEYAFLTGCNNNKKGLKQEIEYIILVAESSKRVYGKHYMVPCDLGHLVSDIFPRCIDVFHDLFLFVLQKDENLLKLYLELMTVYCGLYMKHLNACAGYTKGHLIIPILLTLDNLIQKVDLEQITCTKNLKDATKCILKYLPIDCLTYDYTRNDTAKFQSALACRIVEILMAQLPISQRRKKLINPSRIVDVISTLSANLCLTD